MVSYSYDRKEYVETFYLNYSTDWERFICTHKHMYPQDDHVTITDVTQQELMEPSTVVFAAGAQLIVNAAKGTAVNVENTAFDTRRSLDESPNISRRRHEVGVFVCISWTGDAGGMD